MQGDDVGEDETCTGDKLKTDKSMYNDPIIKGRVLMCLCIPTLAVGFGDYDDDDDWSL